MAACVKCDDDEDDEDGEADTPTPPPVAVGESLSSSPSHWSPSSEWDRDGETVLDAGETMAVAMVTDRGRGVVWPDGAAAEETKAGEDCDLPAAEWAA